MKIGNTHFSNWIKDIACPFICVPQCCGTHFVCDGEVTEAVSNQSFCPETNRFVVEHCNGLPRTPLQGATGKSVFFFPQLKTDKQANLIEIDFKLCEDLGCCKEAPDWRKPIDLQQTEFSWDWNNS